MLFLSRLAAWWRERQRNIFHYYDGSHWRRADPAAIGASLDRHLPDYVDVFALLAKPLKDLPPGPVRDDLIRQKKEGADKLAAAAYRVFDLKPLTDSGGVTSGEAVGILTTYFVMMEHLAEEAGLFAPSPAAG